MIAGVSTRHWLSAVAVAAGLHAAAFAIWGVQGEAPASAGNARTELSVTVSTARVAAAGSPEGAEQSAPPASMAALPVPLGNAAARETERRPEPPPRPEPPAVDPAPVETTGTITAPAVAAPHDEPMLPDTPPPDPTPVVKKAPLPDPPPVVKQARVPDPPQPDPQPVVTPAPPPVAPSPVVAVRTPKQPVIVPLKVKPAPQPVKKPVKVKRRPDKPKVVKKKRKKTKKRRRKVRTARAAQPGAPVAGRAKSSANRQRSAALGNGATARGPAAGRNHKAYLARILARLRRAKRFPETARLDGRHGTARLFFTVLKSGRVVKPRIARSSGHAILDRAALAMLRRASPMPPIPAGVGRNRISVNVPVRFRLR